MDWSKTKTVFIITFLILDLFLGYHLFEKNKDKFEYIAESSIEEKLEAEDITYVNLPKQDIQETYITGKKKHFLKDDFAKFQNQTITFINEHHIISILEESIPLKNNQEDTIQKFLKEQVISGSSYLLWKLDEKTNSLLFFQNYKGKPIYFNESGMLSIQLNENNEIVGYEQTLIEEFQEIHDETNPSVIYAEKALETLYNRNLLQSNSHVTNIALGYYNVVPVSGDVQFFAPTWHVVVNGETDYFVNAIEGQIMN